MERFTIQEYPLGFKSRDSDNTSSQGFLVMNQYHLLSLILL